MALEVGSWENIIKRIAEEMYEHKFDKTLATKPASVKLEWFERARVASMMVNKIMSEQAGDSGHEIHSDLFMKIASACESVNIANVLWEMTYDYEAD